MNGLKEKHSRGYKFATLTIIGRNTPIVLAIEPVKNASKWEPDDAESMSYGEVVERLLERAERHVDIHKVMADDFIARNFRSIGDPVNVPSNAEVLLATRTSENGLRKRICEPVIDLLW